MKKLFILLTLIIVTSSVYSFSGKNTYVIKGETELKEGIAILNDYMNPDTVKIKNGFFEFKGTIQQPSLISLKIASCRSTRIIIEAGEITVTHNKKDGYRLGGTLNNIRFQKIEDRIKPYTEKVTAFWQKYKQAEGDERVKLWWACDRARKEKLKKTGELVRNDSSFAGFVQLLPIHQQLTATHLKNYLEQFQAFKNERAYKRIEGYYQGAANTNIGVIPPTFNLPDPEGKMRALSSFKGKYLLIDFWYSGCGWCRKMTPHLIKIYADLKDKGFEIVSISVDPKKHEAKWRKAMVDDKASWTQLWDAEKLLPKQYSVTGYPTMFFLDKDGKVLQRIYGYHEEAILREFFAKYIK